MDRYNSNLRNITSALLSKTYEEYQVKLLRTCTSILTPSSPLTFFLTLTPTLTLNSGPEPNL